MKKLIGFLLVLAVVFVCAFPALAKIEVNGEGKVRIIDDNWRPPTEAENKAFVNPGKEIPMKLISKEYKYPDLFHFVLVQRYEQVVAYIDGKFITVAKSGEVAGKEMLAVHRIFGLTMIFFMAILNIAFFMKAKMNIVIGVVLVSCLMSAVLLAVITISSLSFNFLKAMFVSAGLIGTVYAVLLVGITYTITDYRRKHKMAVVLFWVSSLLSIA